MLIIIIIIIMVLMLIAIIYMLHDDAVFWGDAERVSKGLKTKKYFTEFNSNKK